MASSNMSSAILAPMPGYRPAAMSGVCPKTMASWVPVSVPSYIQHPSHDQVQSLCQVPFQYLYPPQPPSLQVNSALSSSTLAAGEVDMAGWRSWPSPTLCTSIYLFLFWVLWTFALYDFHVDFCSDVSHMVFMVVTCSLFGQIYLSI